MTLEQLVESINRQINFIENTTIVEVEEKYEKALKAASTFEEKDELRKAHEAVIEIHNKKIGMLKREIVNAESLWRGKA